MKKILFAIILVFMFTGDVYAEVIRFVSGEYLECKIVKRDESFIRVLCDKGVPYREYLISQISSISKDGNTEYLNKLLEQPKKNIQAPMVPGQEHDSVLINNSTVVEIFENQKIIPEEIIVDNKAGSIKKESGIITIVGDIGSRTLKEKITDYIKTKERDLRADFRRKKIDFDEAKRFFILSIAFGAVFIHLLISLPIFMLARQFSTGLSFLAWVPFLNLFLLCRIANISCKWLLFLLIPAVNIIFMVIFSCVLWWLIAKRCGKPGWLGLLILLPGVSLVVPFYLAATHRTEESHSSNGNVREKEASPPAKKASGEESSEELKKRILGQRYMGQSKRL